MAKAKFRHIAIATEDPRKLADWYMEVFGLEEVGRSGHGGVYLTDGDINFAILYAHPDEDGKLHPSVTHFGFMLEDPEATYSKLVQTGAQEIPASAIANQYFERKFRAPDGLSFDISEHGWPGTSPVPKTVEAAQQH